MSTIVTPSVTYTTFLVGDMQIACDYSEWDWCHKAPAKWSLWVMCETCLFAAHRLAGDDCKDFLMCTEEMMECPRCGEVQLARMFLKRVDAL